MARTLSPKRQRERRARPVHDPAPGNPLHAYLAAWLEWGDVTGWSPQTLVNWRQRTLRFIAWCDERGITEPAQITRPVIERYQRHLWLYRKTNGQPLGVMAQRALLNVLASWFRWLVRNRHVLHNPAADLELPRKPKQLPKSILSVVQIEEVLNQAQVDTPLGVRNRAMMEVLYASGVRRMELVRLKLYDVDTAAATLMVRAGKGEGDRFLPLGERAAAWVARYLTEVRPQLSGGADENALFLDDFGRPMKGHFLGDLVRRHSEAAGITTPGACHVFRHAMATHMLDNGADIRFIQAMLGHADLSTTEIYTHVSMAKLKQIHSATHPARLERARAVEGPRPGPGADRGAEGLLQALAREGEGEEEDEA